MTPYTKTTKKQLEVWDGTFSTVMTNYKNAFVQCRKSNVNCDTMKSQLDKAHDTLTKVKNMENAVNLKVNAKKLDISNFQKKLDNQTQDFQYKLQDLNSISDSGRASNTLRKDKKINMTYDYFTLAYYVLTNILMLYLLHKQYKFSALYFLAVFLVLLIIIFILAWWNIPYN